MAQSITGTGKLKHVPHARAHVHAHAHVHVLVHMLLDACTPTQALSTLQQCFPLVFCGLGYAGFAVVKRVTERATGKQYAVKIMSLPPAGVEPSSDESTRWGLRPLIRDAVWEGAGLVANGQPMPQIRWCVQTVACCPIAFHDTRVWSPLSVVKGLRMRKAQQLLCLVHLPITALPPDQCVALTLCVAGQ